MDDASLCWLNPTKGCGYDRLYDYLKDFMIIWRFLILEDLINVQTGLQLLSNDNICLADVLQFGVREKAFFEYISHLNIVQLRQVVTTEKGG